MERHQRNAHLTREKKTLDELERYELISDYYMDNHHRMVAKNKQYLSNVINRKYEIEQENILLQRIKKLRKLKC